jgi:hypothetical protein
MATEAGKGEHHVYRIVLAGSGDTDKLSAGKHYVGIDAVAWFINKQSTWFTDRISSGTLDVKLASGLEKYQAALGTFDLKGGAKYAPVFERPVLPDRNYRGGVITLAASLMSIKKNTAIGGMLMSAASASLNVVAGMVQTAAITGPAKLLTAAGEDLIGGVKKVLSETGEKREPLFDFSGLEYTVQPDAVVGPEIFLLLHRGAALEEKDLTVKKEGQLLLPNYKGLLLDDGAWLLLRLRRSTTYSGVRDWYEAARAFRSKLSNLVSDVGSGVVTKEDALKKLKPSAAGDTLFDEYAKLRSLIQNDGVLSELEAGFHVGQLKAALDAAQKAISQNSPAIFDEAMKQLKDSLLSGEKPAASVAKAFQQEVVTLMDFRRSASGMKKNLKGSEVLSSQNLFTQMRALSKVIKKSII